MSETGEQQVAGGVAVCRGCGEVVDGPDRPGPVEVAGAVAFGLVGVLLVVVVAWGWRHGLIQTALDTSPSPKLAYLGAGLLAALSGHAALSGMWDAAEALVSVMRRRP